MSPSLHWALRGALRPAARRRVRTVVDLPLARVVGSWCATRALDKVCLTFDDGPDPYITPPLLDVLEERGAPSTFFVLVDQCQQFPGLVREMARRGHDVALHGRDHARLPAMSADIAYTYLRDAREELQQIVGRPVNLYRPPYGAQSLRSYRAVRRAGLTVVVWSADAEDWVDRSSPEVVAAGLAALEPGGILLLHERLEPDPLRGAPVTTFDRLEMVRGIVDGCRARGLEPETVSAAVAAHGAVATAWFRP